MYLCGHIYGALQKENMEKNSLVRIKTIKNYIFSSWAHVKNNRMDFNETHCSAAKKPLNAISVLFS